MLHIEVPAEARLGRQRRTNVSQNLPMPWAGTQPGPDPTIAHWNLLKQIFIAIALLSHHLTQAAAMRHGPVLWRDKEPGDLSSYPSPIADTLCGLGKPLTLWTSVSSSVK